MNLTVTIGAVTYNSALFIQDTLESIYNQTYEFLDLVISDDYSNDTTLDVVNQWISHERVRKRFQSIKVLSVPQNTGVSANCNRIIKVAQTDWIKFIAGDDILMPDCITDNIQFVDANPDARIVFSQVYVYQDSFKVENFVKTTPGTFPDNLFHTSFTANDQFKILIESDRIHFTPSFFFNKKALARVGNYEEENRLVEDYPMWLKLTKADIRLHYFHKPTVGYRIHKLATNNSGEALFMPSVLNSYWVRKKYAHPHLPWLQVKQESWGYHVSSLFSRVNLMNPNLFNKLLYRFLILYGNPFFWFNAIFKRIQ